MKYGVIDVGGGMRAAYGAGFFDWCMDNGVHFDYCIGVSAGSANVVSYLAGQRGRNYVFYTDYDLREECMGYKNFLKTGSFVDLEYAYGTLSNSDGEYPLDFEAVLACPAGFKVVATNALTGKAHYFDVTDMKQDDYGAIKASSCVPAINRPYVVDGVPYFDGGMSDPIPIETCFKAGCDRVVVVLTRPKDFERDPRKDLPAATILRREFPEAAEAMRKRALTYNTELWLAKQYEKQGRVLIVAPDDIGGMRTLKRDRDAIDRLYHKGYEDAVIIRDFMKE